MNVMSNACGITARFLNALVYISQVITYMRKSSINAHIADMSIAEAA